MCDTERKETLWRTQIMYGFQQIDPSRLFVASTKGSERNVCVHHCVSKKKNDDEVKDTDFK